MYVTLLQFPYWIFSPILLLEDDGLENEGEECAKTSAGHKRAVKALELKQLLSPVFEHAAMGMFGL